MAPNELETVSLLVIFTIFYLAMFLFNDEMDPVVLQILTVVLVILVSGFAAVALTIFTLVKGPQLLGMCSKHCSCCFKGNKAPASSLTQVRSRII